MKFEFFDRRRAERFAELLDETGLRTPGNPAGRAHRHHSRGPADSDLAELVAIGHSLSAVRSTAQVGTEFRTGLRAMLVATAERDGIGATATAEADPLGGQAAGEQGRGVFSLSSRRIRARGAIVIGVAAGAMAVSGISAASENASPGDALYGVKRSTERAQLAMAGSDVTRGQLSLDFARNRLTEAAALTDGGAGFAGVLDDMDADTRQGVKLLNEAAVARKDKTPLARIDTFVTGQRRTFAPLIGRMASADKERASVSLTLLDNVQARTEELRAGLSCGTLTPAGNDSLGPRLRDCMSGQDSSTTDGGAEKGHGHKQGAKPSSTTTGVDPEQRQKLPAVDEVRPEKTKPTPGVVTTKDNVGDVSTPAPATTKPRDSRTRVAPADEEPAESPIPVPEEDKGVVGGLLDNIFGRG